MNPERAEHKTTSYIVSREDLSLDKREEMFNLYFRYFENTSLEVFISDLSRKDHIIIINNRTTDTLVGFCTLKVIDLAIEGYAEPVTFIFTGDTIVDRSHWGQLSLMKESSHYAGAAARKKNDKKAYWFLITKGYRTYKTLPVYAKHYYPCYSEQTPHNLQQLLNHVACHTYPNEYDSETNLIIPKCSAGNLRTGVSDITIEKRKDPNVDFFAKINPGHVQGNELACICELSEQNLKSFALKYFIEGLTGRFVL